ncbi:hypothetical protein F383_38521 [Gossypium arboreum]|uniref:Uncharacterized protein n=1 Tax=Gossypium arboreum TaxID=29729 RepID=A0A0B0ML03_GOSAR|nr:hypothetical protein F383_38521 [Gossypium arboreum]
MGYPPCSIRMNIN